MVNINKLRLTLLQQDILRYLFIKAGNTFNARALSIALNVSPPAISKALPDLEKAGAIYVNKDKRLSIELNRDNQLILGLKRADNLKQLYESGMIQYIHDNFPGYTVILFGSYAYGEDTINSDIDIAIIGTKSKDITFDKFEKSLERKIILNHFKSFDVIDKHLLNNILNGITLKGAVHL
jgi:predicted nucleotidyltransferase